jgi:putative NADPH-quinone reductase
MNILLILAHPNKTSLNHAIAQTAAQTLQKLGHCVIFHDLYEEKFDPLMQATEIFSDKQLDVTIEQRCRELAQADGVVVVHPNWWGQPPAILKGWIDRVVRDEVAYRFVEGDSGEGVPVGLLKASKAVIFNTSNTNPERELRVFGDPLETLWKNCVFGLCGVKHVHRRMFTVVITSSEAQRKAWLAEVAKIIAEEFPNRAH